MIETALAQIVELLPDRPRPENRFVVALAGPPAAGKSTLAEALDRHLDGRSALLGLDAFHFDNSVLLERGHRARKGAPHTFDVAAYSNTLGLLRREPGIEVSVPVFDRSMELSRNCARVFTPTTDIVVTEGNYLFTGLEPWKDLTALFDLRVWVDATDGVIESRIMQRWHDHGLSVDEARRRWETNDRPNVAYVREHALRADISFES